MIELTKVGFAYGPRVILNDVHAHVAAGELVCIVGANGAGKTTLVKLIAGLLAPSRGQVTIRSGDGGALNPTTARRRQVAQVISFLPQSYEMAFPFTVRDVVLMGRYSHRRRGWLGLDRADDVERAQRAMERCDIGELAHRRFDQLSGGEKRRALLAQAFCQSTSLILLDEPTASLDPKHAKTFFEALRLELASRGATAVAVTHDLNLASRYADRLWLVSRQAITAQGPPRKVLTSEAAAAAFSVDFHVGVIPGTRDTFVVPR